MQRRTFSINGGALIALPDLTFSGGAVPNSHVLRNAIEALQPGYVGQFSGQLFITGGNNIRFAIGGSAPDAGTAADALRSIEIVDAALASVSLLRGTVGAFQNRMDSMVANQQTTVENLYASRGRIVDADFAVESAQLGRARILQQAGIAMLAQANAIPRNVLALLR